MDTKEVPGNICTIVTVEREKAQIFYLCKIEGGCRCDLESVVLSLMTADLQGCSPVLHPEEQEANKNRVSVERTPIAPPYLLQFHRFPKSYIKNTLSFPHLGSFVLLRKL